MLAYAGMTPSAGRPTKSTQPAKLTPPAPPDPRDKNTRYRPGPVLTLIALALLAGRREIAKIARCATTLTPPQRRRLNLPLKQGTQRFYQVPGYAVFSQGLTPPGPGSLRHPAQ